MVLISCGNPISAKVVNSGIACKLLNITVVKGKTDSFDFTGTASKSGLAQISKYVFSFGDGSSKTVSSSRTSVKTSHTYTKIGKFTAKVTVYGTAPGSTNIKSGGSGNCAKPVSVIKPQCVKLGGEILDQKTYSYRFIAQMNTGGAKFLGADFNFGDGKTAKQCQNGQWRQRLHRPYLRTGWQLQYLSRAAIRHRWQYRHRTDLLRARHAYRATNSGM